MDDIREFEAEYSRLIAEGLKTNSLRRAYEAKVRMLSEEADRMRGNGVEEEQIARELHARRRALGKEYKESAPPLFRAYIYDATERKYGDPLGPAYAQLREKKTAAEIIESASRPIENLDHRLTVDGFKAWFFAREDRTGGSKGGEPAKGGGDGAASM